MFERVAIFWTLRYVTIPREARRYHSASEGVSTVAFIACRN